jgi:hypothetical protein
VTDVIDPDELPFTVEEIFEAGCRFLPADAARRMADHLGECGPGLIEIRNERRAVWRAGGIPGAEHLPLYGWVYPDELLPALAGLSPELARRVASLRSYMSGDHHDRAV